MVLRVAINNYRLSGEYGFAEATGISESDAIWSSVKDLGDDRGQVRILIAEYIRSEGTIRPYSETNWSILTEETTEEILTTEDLIETSAIISSNQYSAFVRFVA